MNMVGEEMMAVFSLLLPTKKDYDQSLGDIKIVDGL